MVLKRIGQALRKLNDNVFKAAADAVGGVSPELANSLKSKITPPSMAFIETTPSSTLSAAHKQVLEATRLLPKSSALRQKCHPVDVSTAGLASESTQRIFQQLRIAVQSNGLMSLSAPQLGHPISVFAVRSTVLRDSAKSTSDDIDMVVNPELLWRSGQRVLSSPGPTQKGRRVRSTTPTTVNSSGKGGKIEDFVTEFESCVSQPGLCVRVTRPRAAKVGYHNVNGEREERHLSGVAAQVFLHELDHLHGRLLTDRAAQPKDIHGEHGYQHVDGAEADNIRTVLSEVVNSHVRG